MDRWKALCSFCGYNEIQEPRKKNILIDYQRLQRLIGARSYDQLRNSHSGWIEEYLGNGEKNRQDKWTDSIAVGSRSFVDNVKTLLGFRAKGRNVIEGGEGYQLREGAAHYKALFGAEKDNIDLKTLVSGMLVNNIQQVTVADPKSQIKPYLPCTINIDKL